MISAIFLLGFFLSPISASQFWVSTVVTEFKIREQCATFWSQTQVCSAPLLRVSTDINNPTQFASKAWPMDSVLEQNENPSFISQWHGSLESVRVSVQIEGSNQLNPFGLVAKCDQGMHPKVSFNQSSPDVWERLTSRVIVIDSQCFSAKILVKMDTECPYCPPPTTSTVAITASSIFDLSSEQVLIAAIVVMSLLSVLFVAIFLITLKRYLELRKQEGFKNFPSLESGISSLSPITNSTNTSSPPSKNFSDIFSVPLPTIDFDDLDVTSVDIEAMPRLGSLVYSIFPSEHDLSISPPVYV